MSALLENLNKAQRAAVLHGGGPALVLAGAGSGKTTVLTTRAAWLLEQQRTTPHNILLVTFTNKAAAEMKERIMHLTGSSLPFVGTFHSMCARMLRIDGERIGLDSNFVIYDTDDQTAALRHIYKEHNFDKKKFKISAVKNIISNAKNELLTPSDYQELAQGEFQQHAAKVYQLYQRQLKQAQAVDFDDLVLKVLVLFERAPDVLSKYQQQFQHVLVDEYQDTNKAQYRLTKLLSAEHHNLYVVGDFSQSIYAWRGADYRNMLLLKQDFPEIVEYQLEQNYRSSQNILDAATQVISHNQSHPILQLWTANPQQEKLSLYEAHSAEDEARRIVQAVRQHRTEFPLDEMAVLYRVNAQSRSFEEALIRASIPYRLVGGTKFYERREIKDVIAYLRLLVNPADLISEQRAIKLGKRRFAKFQAWQESLDDRLEQPEQDLPQLIKEMLDASTYLTKFKKDDEDDLSRLENIQEFISVSAQFETISAFLENVALLQNDYFANGETQLSDDNKINLMSLHAAKGLEFGVVFMVGMEEGLFPHSRSLLEQKQLEEERRLCYVGITRAKERLHLSYATSRYLYGTRSPSSRSRFLADIDPGLIQFASSNPSAEWGNGVANGTGRAGQGAGGVQSSGRRLVVDESMIDDIIQGEVDIEALIDS